MPTFYSVHIQPKMLPWLPPVLGSTCRGVPEAEAQGSVADPGVCRKETLGVIKQHFVLAWIEVCDSVVLTANTDIFSRLKEFSSPKVSQNSSRSLKKK